ncbi:hypothetical protein HHI36_003857 [Cryptolaemus montrouzieri]|uniref:Integral membrane protein 2 n=1 Tax=Cryptolaemus montrouzieri TaxID=559131 RepID=A0ABD2NPP2_9CUCU
MTILIKPFTEKKGDKLVVPLVTADQLAKSTEAAQKDAEAQNGNIVFVSASARRVTHSTVLGLFIAALIVVSIGIIGGLYFHHRYLHIPRYKLRIDGEKSYAADETSGPFFYEKFIGQRPTYNELQEELEIDLVNEEFEKIDVPDFRDGRNGRFIHDFNTNTTGIIDMKDRRCFVMPLNWGHVLPPKSFFDLINKMWDGYYKVDTEVVRETMRVVLPPLKDTKEVGAYIAQECQGMPIYKLEQLEGGAIEKRSADLNSEAKFSQFSGKGITEIKIVNLNDVENYEKSKL